MPAVDEQYTFDVLNAFMFGTKMPQDSASTVISENKAVFPTYNSLFKMLYLAMMDITRNWIDKQTARKI